MQATSGAVRWERRKGKGRQGPKLHTVRMLDIRDSPLRECAVEKIFFGSQCFAQWHKYEDEDEDDDCTGKGEMGGGG